MDVLTRAAITGSSREAPPAGGHPTDDLLGSAKRSPERDLLLRAGMHAVYRAAGLRAEAGSEAPVPAPEETMPPCSAKAAEVVRQLLAGRRGGILPEALERLRLAGLRLPPALLPAALGVEQPELRPAVAAVLGERGRWLAGQNPAWRWADGGSEQDDETVWEEGALEDRLAALRRARLRSPEQGLAWVEHEWKSEKAEARAAFVETLGHGLSLGDEAFLETALDDRSARVREAAAALLARIPGSAYAQRATARADSVVVRYELPAGRVVASLTRLGRSGRLVVELPEDVDRTWKRDLPGVDKPPPGMGEKAWKISRALATVPPNHWEERFGVAPPELIVAARGEWEAPVLAGWCRATTAQRKRSWATPLWERCYRLPHDADGGMAWEAALSLVKLLPQASLASALEHLPPGGELDSRLASTLRASASPWCSDLSDAYLRGLRKRISGVYEYGWVPGRDPWVDTLSYASMALSTDNLDQAIRLQEVRERWADLADHLMRAWEADLVSFEETLELRRKLVEEIQL